MSLLLLVAAAVAVIASAGAAQQAARPVVVTATCPNNENAPLNFTVNPWTAVLNQGQDTRWNLNINNSNNNRIVVNRKTTWPYPQAQYAGDGTTQATNMSANGSGTYSYDIRIFCGAEEVVIDPRMRVR